MIFALMGIFFHLEMHMYYFIREGTLLDIKEINQDFFFDNVLELPFFVLAFILMEPP
jgi:hypothetical protein